MSKEQRITESEVAMDVDQLMEEYDLDTSKLRKVSGNIGKFISLIAILFSTFQFLTAGFGTLLSAKQRSLHVIFAFVLGFLLYPAGKKSDKTKPSILDYIFSVLTVIVFGYLFVFVEQIANKGGNANTLDMILGISAILITLEVTRRVVGPELPIVALIFLAYAKLGPYMPGLLGHRGYTFERIVSHMYLTLEGIMGIPLGVSATFVFMFILFGSFLDKTGVGKFFIDLAYAMTGHTKSGPAMTAVVASGLMGSVSGSSVANTVTTGAFTIPLMKKTGYEPHFAGAVEATASTGGQIMPPVMGAAAFIMAEFTGISYINIVICAAIPAILYYFAVGVMVHLEASKLGLKGLPREQLPKVSKILMGEGYLLLPLIAIIVLLVMQYTPTRAAFVAIIISMAIALAASLMKKNNSFGLKEILGAFESGGKGAVGVACACACAGMVVGVVTLTGLGLRIAELIVTLAAGKLLPTLFLTMIASIILGMGLPTTAKYIVLATMAVPALIKLGVNLMAAHLFILYFGVVADITPPVALAAYAGAGIAGANSMKTGFQAVKLASAAFIVPYIFAINPSLILVDDIVGTTITFLPIYSALPMIVTALIGIMCLAGAIEGYLVTYTKWYERIVLGAAAILLLDPGLLTDAFGLVALVVTFVLQKNRAKKELPA
ncbi:MAG: TRAP transporter permease [Tissierellaceae bacterium]|nr:TRAP transporter permease [Tissierellaceae bacterium]